MPFAQASRSAEQLHARELDDIVAHKVQMFEPVIVLAPAPAHNTGKTPPPLSKTATCNPIEGISAAETRSNIIVRTFNISFDGHLVRPPSFFIA
jgi:hypothetical protein